MVAPGYTTRLTQVEPLCYSVSTMISSDRRHSDIPRPMAWRAPARNRQARRVNFALLRFLALLLPVVAGAAIVAQLQHIDSWSSPLVPVLGCIVACAAGIMYHLDGRQRVRPEAPAIRVLRTPLPGIAAPIAVAACLGSTLLTSEGEQPVAAAALWALGMLLLVAHAFHLERPKLAPPSPLDAAAMIGLLALCALLRLPNLDALPSFVHTDEAQMGLHVHMAFDGKMPSLFSTTDWWSVPWLGPAMQAPLLLFVANGLTAVRVASVLYAMAATAGLWFLGTELWGARAGYVAALLFTILAPSVHFGRDGVHYMQSIAALVLTVLCYTRATRRYSAAYAALTGILVGVDVQLYYAARLAVPLVFLHAIVCALMDRALFRTWVRIILWTFLGVLVSFMPMAVYYVLHPSALQQRTDAVFLFSSSPLVRASLAIDYGSSGWMDILGRQAQRVVLGFLSMGDRSSQYGNSAPLLDPVTAALVPAAIALALARFRQSNWLLCLMWVLITVVLGGLLTTEQPDAPRLLAALPALCLLVGGLVHTLLNAAGDTGLRDPKPLLALTIAGALIAAAVLNLNSYPGSFAATEAQQPVTLTTDVARFLSDQPSAVPVVLYDQRQFYLAHWTIRLLAPQISGVTVWDKPGLLDALAAARGPFLLVAVDADPALLARVSALYSGGSDGAVPTHTIGDTVRTYSYPGQGLS